MVRTREQNATRMRDSRSRAVDPWVREIVYFLEEMHWLNVPKEQIIDLMSQAAISKPPRGIKRPAAITCPICGAKAEGSKVSYDHDHKTGMFRDWICNRCNTGLGTFRDSVPILREAACYLESHTALEAEIALMQSQMGEEMEAMRE